MPNPVLFYGVSTPIYAGRVAEVSDAPYCIQLQAASTNTTIVTYGHLGGYRCPQLRLCAADSPICA